MMTVRARRLDGRRPDRAAVGGAQITQQPPAVAAAAASATSSALNHCPDPSPSAPPAALIPALARLTLTGLTFAGAARWAGPGGRVKRRDAPVRARVGGAFVAGAVSSLAGVAEEDSGIAAGFRTSRSASAPPWGSRSCRPSPRPPHRPRRPSRAESGPSGSRVPSSSQRPSLVPAASPPAGSLRRPGATCWTVPRRAPHTWRKRTGTRAVRSAPEAHPGFVEEPQCVHIPHPS